MYGLHPETIPSVVVARPGDALTEPPREGDVVMRRRADGRVRGFVVRREADALARIVDADGRVRPDIAVVRLDAAENIWPWSGSAPCTFNQLDPRPDGVGAYHFNSFIVFFTAPSGFNTAQATRDLLRDFAAVFNPNNRAAVARTQCSHNGAPAYRFTFDVPGPDLHSDWVTLTSQGSSFVARTLERRWYTPAERALGPIGTLSGMPVPTLFGSIAIDVNRRHFLAGRRSWRVGRVRGTSDFYVETAAFERYSHPAFLAASRATTGVPVLDMRQAIVDVWTIMLSNFLRMRGVGAVPRRPAGYRITRGVAHREASDPSAARLRGASWVHAAIGRHPGL